MDFKRVPKRVLLVTQWFDPEPTFKGLLFAKELLARGYEVEVITGFPNYPGGRIYEGHSVKAIQSEYLDGVLVRRVALYPSHDNGKIGRALNYLSFAVSALLCGLFVSKRPDIVYAYHPPLTVSLAAMIVKFFRRVPVVMDIQDIWPDTLAATGMIKNRVLLSLISKICDVTYKSADKIVVLSPGFKQLLIGRNVPEVKIEIIYNWTDEEAIRSDFSLVPDEIRGIPGFKILFAGNVGKAQDLGVVVDAAYSLKNDCPTINFFILGRGLELDILKRRVASLGLENIYFLEPVGMREVGSFLNAADALLIHLRRDPLFEITIPGKTQAYMAAGKPILMGVAGDAGRLVANADCGLVFDPGNPQSLAAAVKKLVSAPTSDLQYFGRNGRAYYYEHLSLACGVNRFQRIFRELSVG